MLSAAQILTLLKLHFTASALCPENTVVLIEAQEGSSFLRIQAICDVTQTTSPPEATEI